MLIVNNVVYNDNVYRRTGTYRYIDVYGIIIDYSGT